jgi:hypothetical protein
MCPKKVVVITQEWPCWLSAIIALKLPLSVAFITKEFQPIIKHYSQLSAFADIWEAPEVWNGCTVLASGSHEYLGFVHSKLKHHKGPFIYSTNIVFKDQQRGDILRLLGAWANVRKGQGLESSLITHADFGGVTSAVHLLSYKNVVTSVFKAPPVLPWTLAHIIDAACPDAGREISKPAPLIGHWSISKEGVLWQEGLLDVFGAPNAKIACPCIFKLLGWAQQLLSEKEFLQAFDIPLDMDVTLLDSHCKHCICSLLHRAITPLVATAIFCTLWSHTGGGGRDITSYSRS